MTISTTPANASLADALPRSFWTDRSDAPEPTPHVVGQVTCDLLVVGAHGVVAEEVGAGQGHDAAFAEWLLHDQRGPAVAVAAGGAARHPEGCRARRIQVTQVVEAGHGRAG